MSEDTKEIEKIWRRVRMARGSSMVYEYTHGADRNFRFLSLLLRFDRFRFFASAARNNTHVRARGSHTYALASHGFGTEL